MTDSHWRVKVAASWVVAVTMGLAFSPAPQFTGDALPKASRSRPSVLLVTLDTVRADHLRCYGYSRIETPNLDVTLASSTSQTLRGLLGVRVRPTDGHERHRGDSMHGFNTIGYGTRPDGGIHRMRHPTNATPNKQCFRWRRSGRTGG